MNHAKSIAPRPKYMMQALADTFAEGEFCMKILFLRVATSELNPIEMVWVHLKMKVAKRSFECQLAALEQRAMDNIEKFWPELFFQYCRNSRQQAQKFWKLAEVVDLTPNNNAPAQGNDRTHASRSAQENDASKNIQGTVTESSS